MPHAPDDHDDTASQSAGADPETSADNTPTVSCSQCDRTWELDYELESLYAGNQAFEQFALDHQRHTGHFPDDITPWTVDCQQCPAGDDYLDEAPARRWAETHARHTRHRVRLRHAASEVMIDVDPDGNTVSVPAAESASKSPPE